jgi:alpha-1,2-mannosyltransferase
VIVAAGLLAATIVMSLFLAPWGPHMLDLEVYRLGASTLLHGGDVYSVVYPGTDLVFTYPVFAAMLFVPLAVVPAIVAHITVLLASLFALWVIVHLTVRSVRSATGAADSDHAALRWSIPLALAAVVAHPVIQTLQFGQINLVLVAMVMADVLPARRGPWRGVLVGIATGIKLVPGLFIVFFLVTGQRRAAVMATLTTAATVALGFLVAPGASLAYWTSYALDANRVGGISYVTNQSILGISARLLREQHPPATITLTLSAIVVVAAILIAARLERRGERLAAVGVVAVASLLASPISWSHHWVWFIPCVGAMVPWAGRIAWRWAVLAAGTLIICIGAMQFVPKAELRELHHTLPQQIVANSFGAVAVAFLIWAARQALRPGTTGPVPVSPAEVHTSPRQSTTS